MAITRSQIARQLFALGGVSALSDDNLKSLGLGTLGGSLTGIAPTGILGQGSMLAGDINRPTSGYETEERKNEKDKAFEELEKEGLFKDLGISPEDLRSQQMKEIEGQTAGLGIFGPISKGLQSIFGSKLGAAIFENSVRRPAVQKGIAATKKANEIAYAKRLELEEKLARAAALKAAQEEINRMGYIDYGSGGADTFDTSNIDDAGNYQDDLDPGQTE
tara:strand:+ start:338 stop:994 length:657 start_codon:yes stop_codon:yes gene_type:complete